MHRLPLTAALGLALCAGGCADPGAAPAALVPAPANPVLDRDFPDPAVLRTACITLTLPKAATRVRGAGGCVISSSRAPAISRSGT